MKTNIFNRKEYFICCFVLLFAIQMTKSESVTPEKIQATSLIKLNQKELEKLGISIERNQISYIETKIFDETNGEKRDRSRKIIISKDKISGRNYKQKQDGSSANVFPRIAVNVFKYGTALYYSKFLDFEKMNTLRNSLKSKSDSVNYYAKANDLVCVYFEFEPKNSKKSNKNQIYLWYEPSNEFIDLLPEEYQKQLRPETDKTQPETNYTIPENSYENVIISTLVYPNPVTNKTAYIRLELAESRNFSIAVYDISGNKVKDFANNQSFIKGQNEITLNLENITSGMYIIMLVSDRQETAKLRIINN
ncbi:MAG TPA: T9SS type A sorting domain-containing protein [Candidatus Kapabacteria bacterium]|nr:T9SS type A sorting domain-containing protein [Candidatus Kapabacteria bacterium]